MKKKFEELKSVLDEKKNELAEAKGELAILKKQSVEKFGTDDVAELKKIEKKYLNQKTQLNEKLEQLEEEIEEMLSQLEED